MDFSKAIFFRLFFRNCKRSSAKLKTPEGSPNNRPGSGKNKHVFPQPTVVCLSIDDAGKFWMKELWIGTSEATTLLLGEEMKSRKRNIGSFIELCRRISRGARARSVLENHYNYYEHYLKY